MKAGPGSREAGPGSKEAGPRLRELGSGSMEAGPRSREAGSGSREAGSGSMEAGPGSREPGPKLKGSGPTRSGPIGSGPTGSRPAVSKKLVELTLKQRVDVLKKLDEGIPAKLLAQEFNVCPSTIRRIRRNAVQVRQRAKLETCNFQMRRQRKPVLEEVDSRLHTWFLERRAMHDNVTDMLLQEKARDINKELGGPETFVACRGWLWRFKQRHRISLVALRGEALDADYSGAESFQKEFLQRLEQDEIELQNVYNVDEAGLLWQTLPRKTLTSFAEGRFSGRKTKKDRVSIGLCSNVTGSHKLQPVFVHRFDNPKALKHCKDGLPVTYFANRDAWMTRKIFADWLEKHFKPAVKQHQLERGGVPGKVLLLLDNCPAHILPPDAAIQDDVELVYLPPNTSSIILPMNQGVIAKVKACFRRRLLRKILSYSAGIIAFQKDYDIKDCINILCNSWDEVTPSNILNSWKNLLRNELINEFQEEATSSITEEMRMSASSIAGEEVSMAEVKEWLQLCEQYELHIDCPKMEEDSTEDQHLPPYPRGNQFWTEEDAEAFFHDLELLVAQRPDLRDHVEALRIAYDERPIDHGMDGNASTST